MTLEEIRALPPKKGSRLIAAEDVGRIFYIPFNKGGADAVGIGWGSAPTTLSANAALTSTMMQGFIRLNGFTLNTADDFSSEDGLVGIYGPGSIAGDAGSLVLQTGDILWLSFNAGSGFLIVGQPSSKKNYTAISNPTTGNDSSQGYTVSSVWLNTVTKDIFWCASATVGAAVWVELSLTTSEVNALIAGITPASIGAAPINSPNFTGVPTAPTASAGTSTTQLATTAFVATALGNLVDSAPGALDTLNELAAALNDDANFAATVTASLSGKLDATEFALAALIEGDPDLIRNACRAVQDPSDDGAGFISVGSQGVKLRGVDSTARLAAGDRFVSFFWDADGPVAESQFWSFENGSEFCPTFLFNGTANRGIWVPDKPGTLAMLDDCQITGEVLISAATVLDASHMGKRLRNISGSTQTIVFTSVSGAVAGKTFILDARANGYVFAGNAPVAQGGVVSNLPAGSGLYQVRAVDGVWMVFGPTPTHTMMLAGDQTAAGQKTFTTSPISTGNPTQGTHVLNRDQTVLESMRSLALVRDANLVGATANTSGSGFSGGAYLVGGTTANAWQRAGLFREWVNNPGNTGLVSPCAEPIAFGLHFFAELESVPNTSEIRFVAGDAGSGAPPAIGSAPIAARGFGFRIYYSAANSRREIQIFVHNGSSYIPGGAVEFEGTLGRAVSLVIAHDGSGTVRLWMASAADKAVRVPASAAISLSGMATSGSYGGAWASLLSVNGATGPTGQTIARTLAAKLMTGAAFV